ncbi:MAG: GAF domain-containing protein [Candidatus Sericytochromatia bacterium]
MDQHHLPLGDEAAERRRLEALRALGILDTEPEERFDRLIRLTARHFRVPVAVISLVDERRCWLKSRTGLDAENVPRELSFCTHAMGAEGCFVVEDAQSDARFRDNPFVTGAPDIRFYAGEPLYTRSGETLGFLCIIDTEPRSLRAEERESLHDFARLVEQELNAVERQLHDQADIALLRREVLSLETDNHSKDENIKLGVKQNARLVVERQAERHRANSNQAMATLLFQAKQDGVFGIDLSGHITFITPAAAVLTGYLPGELVGKPMHETLHHSDVEGRPYDPARCPILDTVRTGVGSHIEDEVFWLKGGTALPVLYTTTPILDGTRVVGAICSFKADAARLADALGTSPSSHTA